MIILFWNTFLYEPLFNFLIWMYNNWTDGNMGWAIIYLTICLRLLLLPLTVVTERNKSKNDGLEGEIERVAKDYHYDPVLQKEEIRRKLKHRRVKPWAKALNLGIQGLVLVLLYQVFVNGITGERIIKTLYTFVDFPGTINTMFFGFDLSEPHGLFLSGIVGIWLMLEIYIEFKGHRKSLSRADLFYFLLLPFSVFILLWVLPMVKALFILTSLAFSLVVHWLMKPFFKNEENA
ncbi:MAG: hypothetical protein COX81_02595 [Candidatus Magasanikbacteria bacterium CG_4_10_14_0_2_um_filter_37_12]|uniref:Membrane insertase YidC/Oxa/ALB C-terminal domain-containing protein n=1 Tax=Candidatus Magasanikbacteria bacterium CG_4_10_14_0_2_um_filter_37_12 TaxID=1974637 RepID=A0A2M7V7U9_9BACT|nr:MAG: hypothetical protein COX81_02595 [Candidatus Magasanikbacteria bacterium CG_4_10_14_0_2_um_filter_37_12]